MPDLELSRTLKTLEAKKADVQKGLAKLDRAIAAIRELAGARTTGNEGGKRRTISAAARQKIARAQKLRWAKVKQARMAKA
jgi:hypothetical protein